MVDQIFSALPIGNDFVLNPIFGYANRGIPGIEIVGLGNQGRSLKEKMIFLNKLNGWDIPQRKYLLCFESEDWDMVRKIDRRNIELPIWLLYMKLAGKIKMRTMRDVVAGGKISTSGEIECAPFSELMTARWNKVDLVPIVESQATHMRTIPLEELLYPLKQESIPQLKLIQDELNG